MDLPNFLFQILEKELQDIQCQLLEKVANKYSLDFNTLKSEFIKPLTLVSHQGGTKIKVIRQQNSRKKPDSEERCNARIWNRGLGGQCSRKKCKDYELCSQHQSELDKQKILRHGYYTDSPPMCVFTGIHKTLYK